MLKRPIAVVILIAASFAAAAAQIDQAGRARERIQRSVRAEMERKRQQNEKSEELKKPKPAVMNVDVQAVLAGKEYPSFAEAARHPATRVTDGTPLWLYIRFRGKLGDYTVNVRDADDSTKVRHLLYAETGPQNDISVHGRHLIEFSPADLALTEVRFNLSPGEPGRNRSLPVLLSMSALGKTGVWQSEIRITNTIAFPRAPSDNLAKAALTLDLPAGAPKYHTIAEQYDSMVTRGTSDAAIMPKAGTFFSEELRSALLAELVRNGITPTRVYFASDGWIDSSTFTPGETRTRKVFAVYTYKRGDACLYGMATISQTFNAMAGSFGEPAVGPSEGFSIPCTQLN